MRQLLNLPLPGSALTRPTGIHHAAGSPLPTLGATGHERRPVAETGATTVRRTPIYGLDIETDTTVDGLDPSVSRIVAVALSTGGVDELFDGPEDELLLGPRRAPGRARARRAHHLERVGAFDLPFIADRARPAGGSGSACRSWPTPASGTVTTRSRATTTATGRRGTGTATSTPTACTATTWAGPAHLLLAQVHRPVRGPGPDRGRPRAHPRPVAGGAPRLRRVRRPVGAGAGRATVGDGHPAHRPRRLAGTSTRRLTRRSRPPVVTLAGDEIGQPPAGSRATCSAQS